ncbi:MAG: DUF4249 family protein, partial [Gemmatimonadaceae bacterium]|nr:DUF4249 family protein [Chitinophagaceae bacterium]
MKATFFLIPFLLLFVSCEKSIDFDLDETPATLVIEATIENDRPPIVTLSNSFAYFSAISPDLLSNSFVHNA